MVILQRSFAAIHAFNIRSAQSWQKPFLHCHVHCGACFSAYYVVLAKPLDSACTAQFAGTSRIKDLEIYFTIGANHCLTNSSRLIPVTLASLVRVFNPAFLRPCSKLFNAVAAIPDCLASSAWLIPSRFRNFVTLFIVCNNITVNDRKLLTRM